ncbi:MAG: hypothetical protein E4G95_03420 [Bacteroidia bacterium]|nr:MAG: hypothetical protein E4G95_03420 [Bacteroidia bacterium]
MVPSITKDTPAEPEDDSAARFETASGRSREDLQNVIDTRLAEIELKVPRETILQLDEEAVAEEDETGEMPEEPLPGFDTSLLDLDYSVQDWLTATPEPVREPEKKSEAELVNSFLASNPRIGPVKELTEGTSFDLTEKAEDRSGGLISETLAMIYLNQKYYTRAIQIYEKLSLKYPEKSSYFAAQIEKIKELIS